MTAENRVENSRIPKKIFQTWKTKELAPFLQQAVDSWKNLNPDYSMYLFDDDDCRNFIAEHFSKEVLWAYDQLIPGAYKADLWRYCVLYIEGGVYADIKLIAHVPLAQLLDVTASFVTVVDRIFRSEVGACYLWLAFMAAAPKQAVLKKTIDQIVVHVQKAEATENPLTITGPGLLGALVNKDLVRDEKYPYEAGVCEHNGITYQFLQQLQQHAIYGLDSKCLIGQSAKPYRKLLLHRRKIENDYDMIKNNYERCWFLGFLYKNSPCHYPAALIERQSWFDRRKKRAHTALFRLLYINKNVKRARSWVQKYIKEYGYDRKLIYYWFEGEVLKGGLWHGLFDKEASK